ncbi:MAG TPA: S41 family peptidase [Thermoanaerobaculia bacterium]
MLRRSLFALLLALSLPLAADAPPRELTPRGLENLIAFTRLYGVIRYFHPSDEAAAADWDAIAVNGAETVEGAADAQQLAARLGDVFLPLAPTVRIAPAAALEPAQLPRGVSIVAWEHHGQGQGGRAPYTSERVRRDAVRGSGPLPDPLQPLRLDLGGGVSASVPLAVFGTPLGTLPQADRKPPAHPARTYTGNDRATRIGAVVIAWNALQHFYPYFDVVDTDWPAELRTALQSAATDRDEAAFLRTLRQMIAALDDGHGSVQHPTAAPRATLPLLWRVFDEALVVVAADAGVSGVSVGDEVVAIDGKPALQAVRDTEQLVSASTPESRRTFALRQVMLGAAGTAVTLTLRNPDGSTRTATLARAVRTDPMREKRPDPVAELKPGLWYVDLTRLKDEDVDGTLVRVSGARGIVLDVRGYPRIQTKLLQHLTGAVTESARWNVPVLRRPDREGVEWDTPARWSLQPLQPRLTKNVVFLTDARAISYAESLMGIVEAYELGPIVGETTAGTNGNVNMIALPGGYTIGYTGLKVLKHDGSRHHGVGIAPTVPVSPTLAAIRAGRDEQLEKALQILEQPPM